MVLILKVTGTSTEAEQLTDSHMYKDFDFSITSTTVLPDKSTNRVLRRFHVPQLWFSFPTKQAFNSFTPRLRIKRSTLQNHYAYIIYNNCTVEEQTGSITGGSLQSVNSVFFSAFGWPHITPFPHSAFLLHTPFLSAFPLTSFSIQSMNIGQHSLNSSSCWKFDKCTPGGSGLNIIFVIEGPKYPPLEYSDYLRDWAIA